MLPALQPCDLAFYLRRVVGDRPSRPCLRSISGRPDGRTAVLQFNSPPRMCSVPTVCQIAILLRLCQGSKFIVGASISVQYLVRAQFKSPVVLS
jgi:hypothetical protein